MKRLLIAALFAPVLAACGSDTPQQPRKITAPRMRVDKISEILYDNTVYYGHYRFTDSTGTHDCFAADNTASGGDSSAGGFAMSCLPPK